MMVKKIQDFSSGRKGKVEMQIPRIACCVLRTVSHVIFRARLALQAVCMVYETGQDWRILSSRLK